MKNACRMGVVVLFMSLGTSGILFAQSDLGRISGFIKDPSGATIANAKVTSKTKRRRTPDRNERFRLLRHHQRPARLLHDDRRGPWFPEVRNYRKQARSQRRSGH